MKHAHGFMRTDILPIVPGATGFTCLIDEDRVVDVVYMDVSRHLTRSLMVA